MGGSGEVLMGWRKEFERIEQSTTLTHRGKYAVEQNTMRRLLDEYEERLAHPWREIARQAIACALRVVR